MHPTGLNKDFFEQSAPSTWDYAIAFSIEKYLSTRLKPKPDEIYDVYHVDLSNEPEAAK